MAVLSWINHIIESTITNSTAEGSSLTSKEKLKTRQLGDKFRHDLSGLSPQGGTLLLDFDLGSAKTTNLVAILGHNLGGLAYHVKFGTTAGASDVADEGPFTFWEGTTDDAPNEMKWLTTPRTARHVRLEVAVTTDQVADIGAVWLDNAWEPTLSMEFSIGIHDPSQMSVSKGQSAYSTERRRARELGCKFLGLTTDDAIGDPSDADLKSLLQLALAVGNSQPIVLIASVASQIKRQRMGVYGHVQSSQALRFVDKGGEEHFTEQRLTVREEF